MTSKDAITLVQMKDETSKECFSSKQHQIMRDRSHPRIFIWRLVGGAKTLNLPMTRKQAMQHARMIRIPSGLYLGSTTIIPEENATIIPPMEYRMRIVGVRGVAWVSERVTNIKWLNTTKVDRKKEMTSNTTNTWKNALLYKTGIPLLLNPPGKVKAAANVTVAISIATTRLVSNLLESSQLACCALFSAMINVLFGVSFFSGDSSFINSRRICCWKIGTPTWRPRRFKSPRPSGAS